MTFTITNLSNTKTTKEVIDVHRVNRVIEVERVNVIKDVITTNIVHKEQINYIYDFINKTVYQPVSALGNIIDTTS